MCEHDVEDCPEVGRIRRLVSVKDVSKVPEEPRTSQTTPANNHTVASGLAHQAKGIFGFPDIPVAENRDAHF